jgi:MFS family permease
VYQPKQALILLLLMTGFSISYMDRALLGVLAPHVQRDLQLDPAELGLAMGCFSLGYTLFALVAGVLTDRFGPRRTISVSMFIWSLFCAVTGAVTNLWQLMGARVIFGAAEAPAGPAIAKMISREFPPHQYGGALGLTYSGPPLGAATAGPVAGILVILTGWRLTFLIVGMIGLIWLIAWQLLAKRALSAPTAQQHAPLPTTRHEASVEFDETTLRQSLMNRTVLASAAGDFALGYLLYFFLSWFPSYLATDLAMEHGKMSVATIVPWVMGALGGVCGGYFADHLVVRLGNDALARKLVIAGGLLLAGGCVILAPQFANAHSALALMGGAVFFIFLTSPNYSALARTAVPERHFGSVVGFITFVTDVAGIVAPIVTGFMIQATGNFAAAFMLAGVIVVAGAAAVLLLGRKPASALRPVVEGAA